MARTSPESVRQDLESGDSRLRDYLARFFPGLDAVGYSLAFSLHAQEMLGRLMADSHCSRTFRKWVQNEPPTAFPLPTPTTVEQRHPDHIESGVFLWLREKGDTFLI
jgi:hypothetical protein